MVTIIDKWQPIPTEYKKDSGQPQITVRGGKGCSIAFNKAASIMHRLGRYKFVQVLGKDPMEFQFLFHNDAHKPASFVLRPEGTRRDEGERGCVFYARNIVESIEWFRVFQQSLKVSTQYELQKVGMDLYQVDFRKPISTRRGPRSPSLTPEESRESLQPAKRSKAMEALRSLSKDELESLLRGRLKN